MRTYLLGLLLIIAPVIAHFTEGPFQFEMVLFPVIITYSLVLCNLLLLFFKSGKTAIYLNLTDVLVVIGIGYVLLRMSTQEKGTINELTILKSLTLIMIYILSRVTSQRYTFFYAYAMLIAAMLQSIIAICQEMGFLASGHPLFDVTGSFSNPGQLSGYIATGLVLAVALFYSSLRTRRWISILLCSSIVIISITLYFTDSRASLLAVLIGLFFIFQHKIIPILKKRVLLFIPLIIVVLVVFSVLLFNYRPASANARLLIWRVSCDMIEDMPIWGHGIDTFDNKYMLYQAAYFEGCPDSQYTLVADNVGFPYNELIHITIELGIFGLFLFLAIIIVLLTYPATNTNERMYKGALGSCITFAMFSYPSYITPLLLCFPLFIGLCKSKLLFTLKVKKGFWLASMFICIGLFVISVNNMFFYHAVSKQATRMLSSQTAMAQINLKRVINHASFGLFYAYYLGNNHKVFSETLVYSLPLSSEIYCCYGDIYAEQKEYEKALYYYQKALYMIPTRIKPNYKLWKLYLAQGDTTNACRKTIKILEQPLKVENTYTLKVKKEVRAFLKTKQSD